MEQVAVKLAELSAADTTLSVEETLLQAIAEIAPCLEAERLAMEAQRGPTEAVAAAMRRAGLVNLRVPSDLGGYEADLALYGIVMEQVAYHNFAAAWCLMLYADSAGMAGANLSAEGLRLLMPDGEMPNICGGGGGRIGELVKVDGGWLATGHWAYGSGIPQAEWVLAMAAETGQDGVPTAPRMIFMPTSALEIEDNWHVMGLRGSGSSDFRAKDVFVPDVLSFPFGQAARYDGPLYKLGFLGFLSLCIPPMLIGLGQRVIDDIAAMAAGKARGQIKKTPLAHRGAFQSFLGEADIRLKAARALSHATGHRLVRDIVATGASSDAREAEARAVGAYCGRQVVSILTEVISYAGGEGIQAGHRFEMALRDANTAVTHIILNNTAYENHAEYMMKLPDVSLNF